MKEKTVSQTSHIEFTAPRGPLFNNSFCILCGLVGVALFIIGWVYITLFPVT